MLATETLPQLDVRQRTLIAISVNLTDQPAPTESTLIHISQIKDYQIWRDRTHVALVNNQTQELVVFGKIAPQSSESLTRTQDIVAQGLWKSIHQYYGHFSPAISSEEIDLASQLLQPLDPTIQNLYQIQQCPQEDRPYAPRKATKKELKVRKKPILNCFRFLFRPEFNPNLAN